MNNSTSDLYSLHWSNHTRNLKSAFEIFRDDNELVDVTLSCEGRKIKAHKIVLSACSVYFLDLFRDNPCQHPIVILRDVKYQDMADILHFMYQGEVNVATECLNSFLRTAELLQVKGLVEEENKNTRNANDGNEQNNDVTKEECLNQNYEHEVSSQLINPVLKTKEESMDVVMPDVMQTEDDTEDIADIHSIEFINSSFANNRLSTENEEVCTSKRIIEALQKGLNASVNKDSSFPCQFCDKVFSHPNSLKLHLPQHSGRTSCDMCNAVLSRKYELKVHMRKKHNIEIP